MARDPSRSLRNQDMTTGSIMGKMLLFTLPVLASSVFSQLYNLVDSVVVGRFVGPYALAAVGSSGTVIMLFHALMIGMNTGAGVIVSQYFGAKQYDELNKSVITLILVSTFITLAMIAIGMPLSPLMLRALDTPDEIMADAVRYMRINFIGTLGQFYYFCGSFILRGMGESKLPALLVIICAVINTLLDLLFVAVFHWGVDGVAWATVIAQAISAAVVLWRLSRFECLDFSRGNWHVDKTKIRPILTIGIPTAVQQVCMSFGQMIIQRFANGFGANFIAAQVAVNKVDQFALMPLNSFSQALTTFVGQNVGAGKTDRVKKGVRSFTLTIVAAAILIGAIMILFGKQLIHIFTTEQEVIVMGQVCLVIMAFSYWGTALQQSYTGLLRGAGVAIVPTIIMIAALVLRIPTTYLFAVRPHDYRGIFYCMAVANTLGGLAMLIYYRTGAWQKHNAIRIRK